MRCLCAAAPGRGSRPRAPRQLAHSLTGRRTRSAARPDAAAHRRKRSARRQDWPMAAEAEPRGGRRSEVVLAPADVRAAVNNRDAHLAPAALERDLRAARQRLVGDAELAVAQRAAAARPVAVEAGAVPA